MQDNYYMRIALALAEKGKGWTHPNPMVGAVIVKEDRIISWGYHPAWGQPHAERIAIEKAGKEAEGATLYVNLEPCCHYGKTPPCCEAIVKAGIGKVVAAMRDPNPLVNGKGLSYLRNHGVEVVEGVLEDEARRLNRAFIFFHETGLPWITGKIALTADGKPVRPERWITSEKARELVHEIRAEHQAIMVGSGTVLADDPLLTVRHPAFKGKRITRVIIDTHLRTPPEAKLFSAPDPVIIFTAEERKSPLREKAEIVRVETEGEGLDLLEVLKHLASKGIISVLVEGGPTLLSSLLNQQLVNEILIFQAGKLGGEGCLSLKPLPLKEGGVENIEKDQIFWRLSLVHRYNQT